MKFLVSLFALVLFVGFYLWFKFGAAAGVPFQMPFAGAFAVIILVILGMAWFRWADRD
jgi:hypothetical protein